MLIAAGPRISLSTPASTYFLIFSSLLIPVIASGGAGTKAHFYDALTTGGADAALAASLFHYKELEIMDLKNYLADRGVSVRR